MKLLPIVLAMSLACGTIAARSETVETQYYCHDNEALVMFNNTGGIGVAFYENTLAVPRVDDGDGNLGFHAADCELKLGSILESGTETLYECDGIIVLLQKFGGVKRVTINAMLHSKNIRRVSDKQALVTGVKCTRKQFRNDQ